MFILNRIKFFYIIKNRAKLIKQHILNNLEFVIKIFLTLDY